MIRPTSDAGSCRPVIDGAGYPPAAQRFPFIEYAPPITSANAASSGAVRFQKLALRMCSNSYLTKKSARGEETRWEWAYSLGREIFPVKH